MPDDAIERAAVLDKLDLWFFRDLSEEQRTKLLQLFYGVSTTDEMRSMNVQRRFLRAAFASQQAPEGWRPIDAAPKDGTEFQAWVRDAKIGSQWWEYRCRINSASEAFEIWGRIDYDEDGFEAYPHIEPTHWMPPPAPPAMLDAAPSVIGQVG